MAGLHPAQANVSFGPGDVASCSPGMNFKFATLVCKDQLTESEQQAVTLALGKDEQYIIAGVNSIIVGMRAQPGDLSLDDRPYLCCDLKGYLDPIGKDIFAAKFRSGFIAQSIFDAGFLNIPRFNSTGLRFNGSAQFVAVSRNVNTSVITEKGHTYSRSPLKSDEFGERMITKITGSACQTDVKRCHVVVMPDGEGLTQLATNAVERGVDLTKLVLVGIHNRKPASANDRIDELLFGYNEVVYAKYMRFAFEVVLPSTIGSQKPASIYTAGFSNGGAWALDALIDRPSLIHGAIVMSAGSWELRNEPQLKNHMIFIGAGLFETGTRRQSTSIVTQLRNRGAIVRDSYPPGGHSVNTWVNIWIDALRSITKNER